jgi:hypothetical protein
MVTMKLRHPYTTASIWSSGKITCTGANTEQEAKTAARKFSRILQKLGERSNIYLGGDGGVFPNIGVGTLYLSSSFFLMHFPYFLPVFIFFPITLY